MGLHRTLALVTAIRECPKIIEQSALANLEDSVVNDIASFLISTGRCGKSERIVASWLRRCISYCDHVSMDVHTPTRDGTSLSLSTSLTHTHTHTHTNKRMKIQVQNDSLSIL